MVKPTTRKLPPEIDFDLYGHCVKCHKNMLVQVFVDGETINRLSGEYREVTFLLSTGSRMNVAICVNCKNELEYTKAEQDKIMKTVIKGWDIESDDLVSDVSKSKWTKEYKDEYMKVQRKKKIVREVGGLGEATVKSLYKDYLEGKK